MQPKTLLSRFRESRIGEMRDFLASPPAFLFCFLRRSKAIAFRLLSRYFVAYPMLTRTALSFSRK